MARNELLILATGARMVINGPSFDGWEGVPDHGFVRHNQIANNENNMYVACSKRTGPWFFPNGTEILYGMRSGFWSGTYMRTLFLHRREGDAPSGIFHCEDNEKKLYVGLYDTSRGGKSVTARHTAHANNELPQ